MDIKFLMHMYEKLHVLKVRFFYEPVVMVSVWALYGVRIDIRAGYITAVIPVNVPEWYRSHIAHALQYKTITPLLNSAVNSGAEELSLVVKIKK